MLNTDDDTTRYQRIGMQLRQQTNRLALKSRDTILYGTLHMTPSIHNRQAPRVLEREFSRMKSTRWTERRRSSNFHPFPFVRYVILSKFYYLSILPLYIDSHSSNDTNLSNNSDSSIRSNNQKNTQLLGDTNELNLVLLTIVSYNK